MCLSAGPECQKSLPRSTEISVLVKASSKVLLLSESIVLSANLIIHREGDKFNHLFLPCLCPLFPSPRDAGRTVFSTSSRLGPWDYFCSPFYPHKQFSLIQRSLFLSYLLSSD